MIWTSSDGRETEVAELGDFHLQNVYKLLQKQDPMQSYLTQMASMYRVASYVRGEAATDAVNSSIDQLDYLFEEHMALRQEIEDEMVKRGFLNAGVRSVLGKVPTNWPF